MLTPVSPSLELEINLTTRLCEVFNTPRSLAVATLVKEGNYVGLKELTTSVSPYHDPWNFSGDYLVTELLRKSPNLPLDIDRKQVAWQSFMDAQAACAVTNGRLIAMTPGEFPEWFYRARAILRKILPPLDQRVSEVSGLPDSTGVRPLDMVHSMMRHGPGATTGVRGDGTVPSVKYDASMHLTVELVPYAPSLMGEVWWQHLAEKPLKIVPGSIFSTAAKNAFTDRPIAKEPTLNVYGQLGIGTYMAGLMKRLGVDITSADKNRMMAKAACKRGYATIDLKSASDLIAYMVVLLLFPEDWFKLLDLFRSSVMTFPKGFPNEGSCIVLEQFSSMGNGFTFALQSVVFLSLAREVVPANRWSEVSIFGDDIILPQEYANDLIDHLHYLGMQVNMEKTFLAGRFFESCGTDWLDGRNVRPFYARGASDVNDDAEGIPYPLHLANQLRLWSWRRMDGEGCDITIKPVWDWLVSQIPSDWKRCRVPPSIGNGGLITSRGEGNPRKAQDFLDAVPQNLRGTAKSAAKKFRDGHKGSSWVEGWLVRQIHFSSVPSDRRTLGVVLSQLATQDRRDGPSLDGLSSKGFEPRRGYLGKPVPGWAIVHWPENLDWI